VGANVSYVVDMSMTEWKLEDMLVVEREEGREEAIRNLLDSGMKAEQVSRLLP
jgi:hypothetical protein